MANDEIHEPLDESLVNSRDSERAPSRPPTVDDVFRLAQALDPDERLRLAGRLWAALPKKQRATLLALQSEGTGNPPSRFFPQPSSESNYVRRPGFWDPPSEEDGANKLYSAPRRFDLATIFVVTAAFSLLLGGLTALDALPIVKIGISAFVTVIAVAQALFQKYVNPRGTSIVAGAIACTLAAWCLWAFFPRMFPGAFPVFTVIIVIVGGAFGYLTGTLVGGVFLIADVLRGKFEGRAKVDSSDSSIELTEL